MPISSQFPQLPAAIKTSALQALALQVGQVIEAKVIGPAPNGGTQVQIGQQLLNLLLPTATAPGTNLQLLVQDVSPQIKLAIQPQPAPTASQPAPTPAPPPALAVPLQTGQPALPTASASTLPAATSANPLPLPTAPLSAAVPVSQTAPTQAASSPLPAAPVPSTPTPAAPASATPVAPAQPPIARPAITPLAAQPSVSPVLTTAPAPSTPAVATPVASTPTQQSSQAALAQMVQAAIPRQNSMAGLATALTAIAAQVPLPEPVMRAANLVLAAQTPIDTARFDGKTLQRAVLQSGVFQEATLARGTLPPTGDVKTALLGLRQVLTSWLGPHATIAQAASVAPPLRGQVMRARPADTPALDPTAGPDSIGKSLLDRTEAALSRLRLHQHASLPESAIRADRDWSMDLPVLIGQHQTVLQLQIHRDAPEQGETNGDRGWQMRFALNLPALGEVGAQVSLRGAATGVMLWAAELETAAALESDLAGLRSALAEAGTQPGAIFVRHSPPAPAQPVPSGHFVDATS